MASVQILRSSIVSPQFTRGLCFSVRSGGTANFPHRRNGAADCTALRESVSGGGGGGRSVFSVSAGAVKELEKDFVVHFNGNFLGNIACVSYDLHLSFFFLCYFVECRRLVGK